MEELKELKARMQEQRPVDWESFPDIGLYMDQVVSYICQPQLITTTGMGNCWTSRHGKLLHQGRPASKGGRERLFPCTHLGYLTAICVYQAGALREGDNRLIARVPSVETHHKRSSMPTSAGSWTLRWSENRPEPARRGGGGRPAPPGPGSGPAQLCGIVWPQRVLDILAQHTPGDRRRSSRKKERAGKWSLPGEEGHIWPMMKEVSLSNYHYHRLCRRYERGHGGGTGVTVLPLCFTMEEKTLRGSSDRGPCPLRESLYPPPAGGKVSQHLCRERLPVHRCAGTHAAGWG